MSELKLISPMLDGMIVEKERVGHNGQTNYILRREKDGERYVLTVLSLPENDSRIRALILSGAYTSEEAVHTYYGHLAEDIKKELDIGQQLASSGYFAGAVSYHAEVKSGGVGYDIYILYPLNISLAEFLTLNAMTGLRAINLGLDLCDAVDACRQAGYLHLNLKPETVFLMPNSKFLIGGLGLTALEFLEYAIVPEEYIGAFTAPEMSDITASPNLTSDIYAIGMILYLIYNGNHGPFEDENTHAVMADRLRLTGKQLPSPIYADYELAEIILKACSFKPEDRYQSPEELKQALILYMQRNAISDELIAPPIVADLDPLPLIDEDVEEEPIRMTDANDLDENFRQNFAPDLSGAGDDRAPTAEPETPEPEKPEEDNPSLEKTTVSKSKSRVPEELIAQDPDQMDLESLLATVEEVINDEKPNAEYTVSQPKISSDSEVSDKNPRESDAMDDSEEPQDVAAPETSEESNAPKLASIPIAPTQTTPLTMSSDSTAASEDHPVEEVDYEPKPKKKKRSKRFKWSLIAVILVALIFGSYLLSRWYFIDITEISTITTTPSQITVALTTQDDPSHFSVICTDSFGNVHTGVRSGNQYSFMSLREKTSYEISVKANDWHAFSTAAPVLSETTNEYTTISNIALERLNIDGDVLLTFDHKGPEPTQWKITYEQKDGTDKHSYRFDGESYQINSLELHKTYIFTLENVDNVFIQGENSITYDVYPRITATNFAIKDISDNVVTLAWDCGEVQPDRWLVSCHAEGEETPTYLDTAANRIEIPIKDFTRSYTFTLRAQGMDKPEELVLDANPIIVSNLAAKPDDKGNLVVTWNTPSGEPDGQWRVSYRLKDGYYNDADGHAVPSASCDAADANSITLKYLPANSNYELTLIALDTVTNTYPRIFGTTTIEVTTPDVIACNEYQIEPAAPYGDGYDSSSQIALWEKPDLDIWDYRDLTDDRRNAFTTDEKIAMCIQIDSCDLSADVIDDTVHISYVVRRASYGGVIMVDEREMKWESVWFDRRHTGIVPMPLKVDDSGNVTVQTGQFLIEVYINGKLLASKGFTIDS